MLGKSTSTPNHPFDAPFNYTICHTIQKKFFFMRP